MNSQAAGFAERPYALADRPASPLAEACDTGHIALIHLTLLIPP